MGKILVFKTAADTVMHQLFHEIDNENNEVVCLIQNSLLEQYGKAYPSIRFIDIHQEGFYNVSADVIDVVRTTCYDKVFIPFTGTNGHNFGNVMELVAELTYRQGLFYNCNGDLTEMPRRNKFYDGVCRCYILIIGLIYSRKEG